MKTIKSPMAGSVWKIVATVGQEIDYGDTIMILESMKMEIPVEADSAGKIVKFLVAQGDVVALVELQSTVARSSHVQLMYAGRKQDTDSHD